MNRKLLASALAVSVLGTPVAIAVADENDTNTNPAAAGHTDVAADAKNQTRKNIRAELIEERREAKARAKAKARARAKKRAAARRAAAAQAQATAGAPAQQAAPQQATGGSTASAGLEGIAACESGGNPSAVSADGQYRGKYQFDQQTWASVGGSGDPAAAPEAEQDQRAAMLQARAGSSPWPNCG